MKMKKTIVQLLIMLLVFTTSAFAEKVTVVTDSGSLRIETDILRNSSELKRFFEIENSIAECRLTMNYASGIVDVNGEAKLQVSVSVLPDTPIVFGEIGNIPSNLNDLEPHKLIIVCLGAEQEVNGQPVRQPLFSSLEIDVLIVENETTTVPVSLYMAEVSVITTINTGSYDLTAGNYKVQTSSGNVQDVVVDVNKVFIANYFAEQPKFLLSSDGLTKLGNIEENLLFGALPKETVNFEIGTGSLTISATMSPGAAIESEPGLTINDMPDGTTNQEIVIDVVDLSASGSYVVKMLVNDLPATHDVHVDHNGSTFNGLTNDPASYTIDNNKLTTIRIQVPGHSYVSSDVIRVLFIKGGGL